MTLAVGGNNANTTFSGSIGGSGGLVKAGSGSLTLTGSNTFTGGLMLDPGIVSITQRRRLGRRAGIALDQHHLRRQQHLAGRRLVRPGGEPQYRDRRGQPRPPSTRMATRSRSAA